MQDTFIYSALKNINVTPCTLLKTRNQEQKINKLSKVTTRETPGREQSVELLEVFMENFKK